MPRTKRQCSYRYLLTKVGGGRYDSWTESTPISAQKARQLSGTERLQVARREACEGDWHGTADIGPRGVPGRFVTVIADKKKRKRR